MRKPISSGRGAVRFARRFLPSETIVFIEKGDYDPSLQLAHNIAKALGTTIDKLFLFDD